MNMSEIILRYLLDELKKENQVQFQRNKLAKDFNCSPSHINYVLKKEFQDNSAYIIEIQKGTGGYIRIRKLTWRGSPPSTSEKRDCISFLLEAYQHGSITKKEFLYMKTSIEKIENPKIRQEIIKDWFKIIRGDYYDEM